MAYLIEFKLIDSTSINAIIPATKSEKEAISLCIKASKHCFKGKKNKKFVITETTKYKAERWTPPSKSVPASGRANLSVMAIYSPQEVKNHKIGQTQGVKSAYAEVIRGYHKNPAIVFIYDVSQRPVRKNPMKLAESVLKDEKKIKEILNKFEEELKDVPLAGEYLSNIPILCEMVMDYQKGVYREVPVRVIVGAVATILYFISPIDLIPDFIPGIGKMDDMAVIMFLLKQCRKEIDAYKNWRIRNNKGSKK